ncbi:unnamed protein product, partial [Discosporangium mesarthrocarpum]
TIFLLRIRASHHLFLAVMATLQRPQSTVACSPHAVNNGFGGHAASRRRASHPAVSPPDTTTESSTTVGSPPPLPPRTHPTQRVQENITANAGLRSEATSSSSFQVPLSGSSASSAVVRPEEYNILYEEPANSSTNPFVATSGDRAYPSLGLPPVSTTTASNPSESALMPERSESLPSQNQRPGSLPSLPRGNRPRSGPVASTQRTDVGRTDDQAMRVEGEPSAFLPMTVGVRVNGAGETGSGSSAPPPSSTPALRDPQPQRQQSPVLHDVNYSPLTPQGQAQPLAQRQ